MIFLPKKKSIGNVSRPRLSGKVSTVGRGEYEQTLKNDSDLCTHAYPYRLALLGTSLRMRGKQTTKEESNQVFYK